ncbi:MAG: PspC domain-containing protein [Acidimicrobiales bacterium]
MVTPTPTAERTDTSVWQIPVLKRDKRLLSGVSAAVADELGLPVLWVRVAWVALFASGAWGAMLYVAVWGVLTWLNYRRPDPTYAPRPKGRSVRHRQIGFVFVGAGLVTLSVQLGGYNPSLVWPLGLAGFGLLLAWRRLGPGVVDRSEGRYPLAQAIGGLLLAALGAALLVFTAFGFRTTAMLYAVIAILAVAVVATSPWWWQVVQDLDHERQERARLDERAAVAAHLHDSVLQTLTLIQRNADDPQTMLNLARRQERELRNWLDPDRVSRQGGSVRGRLDDMASEVEELYHIPVEVVTASDCLVDDAIDQLLAATREAMVNASKHAEADQIDVYAEVRPEAIEIFVRDRGVGFDPDAVAIDRRGMRESIEGRMKRIGGECSIYSTPGGGTEVELRLKRNGAARSPVPRESEPS